MTADLCVTVTLPIPVLGPGRFGQLNKEIPTYVRRQTTKGVNIKA